MAAVQSAARTLLGGLDDEHDVMRGLARRVLASGQVEGLTIHTPTSDEVDATSLRRSPVLAALGFEIGQYNQTVQSLWIDGVERLRGREAFPGDGQSFVHSPGEVLGVMSGLEALGDNDNGHRDWLKLLMQRGLNDGKFRTPIARLAASICVGVLNPGQSDPKVADEELRLLTQSSDLLQAAAMIIAYCPAWLEELYKMEEAFTAQVLAEPISLTNPAEAAAALVLARRVTDRLQVVAGVQVSPKDVVVALCRRFPLFAKQMMVRHGDRLPIDIQDEYDVQDLFHAILRLHFDDVRAEDVSPDFGGNSARVDFFLPRDRIAIEVKMMRSSLTQRKVTNELIEDIARYTAKDGVDTLICLVYDPEGRCQTPRAIETDLSKSATRLNVSVVVCPQGI
jgi:hypothetical protein